MPKPAHTMNCAILRVLSCSANFFGIGEHDAEAILNQWKENNLA
jgi:hypothetical protein